MRKLQFAIFLLAMGRFVWSHAQDAESLRAQIDETTEQWDIEAINLKYYDGLMKFCKDVNYRTETIELLTQIHHYDSVLYERAKVASSRSSDKEIKKLIKEIENFEKEYSMKNFIHFLHDECKAQNAIEKDSKNSKSEIGSESYDSQIYMLEIELAKYVKHITKRVDSIRKHVHHLGVK